MWKSTLRLAFVAFVAGGIVLCGQAGEQPPKKSEKKDPAPAIDKKKVKELMTRKLDHTQKLLAALVTNDLDKAAKETEELMRVRKEASWYVYKTEQYEMWSKEFTISAEEILKAAKEKNLDAAKLRYLQLTMTCFHCHTYVRDLGDIRLEDMTR